MKYTINNKLQKLLKENGIDCEVGQTLTIKNEHKRQQQKLIFDYVEYIRLTLFPNWTLNGLLSMLMIEFGYSENSVVKVTKDIKDKYNIKENYLLLEVRKSLALSKNTKESYLKIIDSLKQFHYDRDIEGYFNYYPLDKE